MEANETLAMLETLKEKTEMKPFIGEFAARVLKMNRVPSDVFLYALVNTGHLTIRKVKASRRCTNDVNLYSWVGK